MEEKRRGKLVVERAGGKSRVTTCFSNYPLKFIVPSKVGPSSTDAVWIYTLTYGGGIVSGDTISCEILVRDGCTAVLTTQASTKVYKSIEFRCSQQLLETAEARVGRDALLAVIPDPVTCFSTARYSQKQVFHVLSESNLVIVDWITSGRHETGEKWDFGLYKSTNHILTDDDDRPVFLDSILLEQGSISPIVELMHGYQVMGMLILFGPKLKEIQTQVQQNVKEIMSEKLHMSSYTTSSGAQQRPKSDGHLTKPSFVASASKFGTKGTGGLVVRIAAMTTESVYEFLNQQLAGLEPYIGVSPYH